MNAAQEYLAARVMTAPPQALHLLVVDGALRHAARAEAAFDAGDRDAAGKALADARSFVGELIGGLDKTAAPEVVSNVAALFVFAYRRLTEADLYGSIEHLCDAAKILRMHRETWAELVTRLASAPSEAEAAVVASAPPSEAPVATPHVSRRVPSEYDDYQPRSWCG